jgi:uncharacterized repeat protein (TIGR03806 family)
MRLQHFASILFITVFCAACALQRLTTIENNMNLNTKLSEYNVFEGDPRQLVPAPGFHLYELSNELFSDYSEKQRLIRIPSGGKMIFTNDQLPEFPDGTVLIKTFYSSSDRRVATSSRTLIETRVLIFHNGQWNGGTYLWNESQSDAYLITDGARKKIQWADEHGELQKVSFEIPTQHDCSSCHNKNGRLTPIGPKLRNLNTTVNRNGSPINQIDDLISAGLASAPANGSSLPRWNDESASLHDRARAYLDINCAHCHSADGFCKENSLRLGYEIADDGTGLSNRKNMTIALMRFGEMPLTGTKLVHTEGLDLVREYIRSIE